MSDVCCAVPEVVRECSFCGCQFAPDVADPGPNGEPRCPQCLLLESRVVTGDEIGDFVVTAGTPFR